MAFSWADLFPQMLLQRPMGGPAFGSLMPKSPTNVTAGSPPAPTTPPQSSDAQFLAAMTAAGQAGPQNELHRAQAEQAKALAKYFGIDDPPPTGFGQRQGNASGGSTFGSLSGAVPSPASMPQQDTLMSSAVQPRSLGGGMASGMGPMGGPSRADVAWLSANMPVPTRAHSGPSSAWNLGLVYDAPAGLAAEGPGRGSGSDFKGPEYSLSNPANIPPPRMAANAPPAGDLTTPSEAAMLARALTGGLTGGAAATTQMAQAMPQQMPAFGSLSPGYRSPFSAEDIAWAQRQDQRNAKIGKRNPTMVDEALKMAPGMPGSIEYKGAAAGAERGAQNQSDFVYKPAIEGASELAKNPALTARAQAQADIDVDKEWKKPTDLQKALLAAGINPASPEGRARMERAFPDTRPDAVRLGEAAGLTGGARTQALAGAIPGNAPTAEQKDYAAYVQDTQGRGQVPMSMNMWDLQRRKSSATLINTAEGFDVAQAKARFTIDSTAAKDITEQAVAGRRMMPLLDEVIRLADKTPGGWAGPIAAETAKAFSALGIPVSDKLSNAELLQSISQRLVPIVREPGPTSEKELAIYLRAVPGLSQSQEGRLKVAEMTKALVNRTNEIAKVYRNNVGSVDLYDKLAALDTPIFSDDQRKAMEAAGGSAATTAPPSGGVAAPADKAAYDALPSGTAFTAPDGSRRIKP